MPPENLLLAAFADHVPIERDLLRRKQLRILLLELEKNAREDRIPLTVEARGVNVDFSFWFYFEQPNLRTVTDTVRSRSTFIPAQLRGAPVILTVTEGKRTKPTELRIRSRVNFYDRQPFHRVRAIASLRPFRVLTAVVLAALLVPVAITLAGALTPARAVIALGMVALAVHFRSSVYFHWDEWHLMQSFFERGWQRVFEPHNEHFLPLSFSIFRGEMAAFGARYAPYLIVAILVHVANAALLMNLLRRLFSFAPHVREASVVAGLLYAVNGLHAESVQWGMEICIALLQTLALVALGATERFVREGQRPVLLSLGAASLLAPLAFGNGLCVPGLVGGIAALSLFPSSSKLDRTSVTRAVIAVATSSLGVAAAATLYVLNRTGAATATPLPNLSARLEGMLTYALTGSQLGTILRGIGFVPHYEPGVAQRLYPSAATPFLSLPWFWIAVGAGVGIALHVLARRVLTPRGAWAVTVCGQLLVLIPMLLPAAGRWESGPLQSLSVRYHVLPLTGLTILLFPLLLLLFARLEKLRSGIRTATTHPLRTLPGLAVWGIVAANLFAGSDFEYFVDHGIRDRIYIAQLRDWRARNTGAYEGTGSDLAGLFPIFPPTMTPGRHPDEIYQTLVALD